MIIWCYTFLIMKKVLYSLVALYLVVVIGWSLANKVSFLFSDNQASIPASLVPSDADRLSQQFISLLIKGDIDKAVSSYLPTQMRTDQVRGLLNRIIPLDLASTSISDMKIVGAYTNYMVTPSGTTPNTYDLTYVLLNNNPDRIKYQIIEIETGDVGEVLQVINFKINPISSFPLKFDPTFKNIALLLLSILIPLFIAYTAFRYIKKSSKPNPLVVLGVLLVVVYLTIAPDHYGMSIGFHSFMQRANAWTPWIFNTPIPLGALLYYIFRKKLEKNKQ